MDHREQEPASGQDEKGITFTLTPKDVTAANDLWRRNTIKPGRFLGFIAVCWVAIMVIVGATGGSAFELVLFPTIVCVIGGACSLISGKVLSRRRALSYFKKMPSSQREITAHWTGEHLTTHTQVGIVNSPWSDFEAWAEDETIVVFLYAGPLFLALPKQAMSAAQLDDLHATLARTCLKRAALFPV